MATLVSVDDIHTNIKAVFGLCPSNPITLVVDNYLGGGGEPQNYYYNWFIKDANSNNTNTYTTTARVIGEHNTRIIIPYPASDPTNEIFIPELNLNIDYRPGGTFDITPSVISALTGFGRTFNVITGVGIEVFFKDDDPLLTNLLSLNQLSVNYWTNLDVQYQILDSIYRAGQVGVLFNRTIKGWIPLAGGVNVDTFIVPNNNETYMVEIVDEVGTPDYGVISLLEIIPICSFEKKNASCNGLNNGSLIVNPIFDSSAGITFAWTKDNVPYSNQKDIYNLSPGTYCLTLTNSNGCQRTCCDTIIEPLPLTINVVRLTQPSCSSCNTPERFGELLVEISGGNTECSNGCTSPYEYSLNSKTFTKVDIDNRILLSNLRIGSYKLAVKDCNCCYSFYEFTIEQQILSIE